MGEVAWVGRGSLGRDDGRIALYRPGREAVRPIGTADGVDRPAGPRHEAIREHLARRGASFYREIFAAAGGGSDREVLDALWDLVWAGEVTNDTFAPLRALRWKRPARDVRRRPGRLTSLGPPEAAGRWSLVEEVPATPTERLHATALALLDRHGVVTREAVASEGIEGGFSAVYPILRMLEEAGRIRRGYFVDGLGAAQFALAGALERLRAVREPAGSPRERDTYLLAAADPANPYGAAVPWPRRGDDDRRPLQRAAGAYVVVVDGIGRALPRAGRRDDPDPAGRRTIRRSRSRRSARSTPSSPTDGSASWSSRRSTGSRWASRRSASASWPGASRRGTAGSCSAPAAERRPEDAAMPEGDTLFRTAAGLRPHLVGRAVTAARATRPGPQIERVVGSTVDAVESHGKNLVIRFDNGLELRTHMRMNGSWHRYRPGERWRRPPARARVVLEVPGAVAVCFDAPVVELFEQRAEALHPGLSTLGPGPPRSGVRRGRCRRGAPSPARSRARQVVDLGGAPRPAGRSRGSATSGGTRRSSRSASTRSRRSRASTTRRSQRLIATARRMLHSQRAHRPRSCAAPRLSAVGPAVPAMRHADQVRATPRRGAADDVLVPALPGPGDHHMTDLAITCHRLSAGDGWTCDVAVDVGGGPPTRHVVTVADDDLERLDPGARDPHILVDRSFRFLLERESPRSILSSFDLMAIARYFPEYESDDPPPHIRLMPLARGSRPEASAATISAVSSG